MVKKIKVLRIIARLNIGGPARHTILLTEGLNNDKFDSVLVSGVVDSYEGDMTYLANEKDVKPIIIPELGRKISLRNDLISFYKLFQIIKKEQPDIIHTHTAKAGTLGRLAALLYKFTQNPRRKRKKSRLVHTFHGHVLHSYFAGFKTRIFILVEHILARFTDRIIAVSNEVKNELIKLKIGDFKKIIVIPLGLDLDKLFSIPESRNNSQVNVGIIGRLVPIKNHYMFIKAIKLLTNCKPQGTDYKFIIAGDGELRESLKSNSRKLGVERFIEFIGWQNNLVDLYSNLDIVVLTSLNEGTPVSLIEAMASARPVVATKVGGVKDLVNEERGFLVESNDVDAFACALRKLIDEQGLRIRLGQSGREFVKERFNKTRLINDIVGLYEELLYRKE
ncbi:MAG: glycosyltransferase family 4 protein [Candidatus Omnitrophica bacterium]|nr:glycosyltransferase family 4 protein [Candidatus Omnitrophota bacterium]